MPDRIVRSNILTSEPINSLSFAAEVFYRRLLSVVDDFGRYDGRVAIIRCALYPLQLEKVSDGDVSAWLAECVTAGVIVRYVVDGKPYMQLAKLQWQARAHASKYPPMQTSANICAQTPTDVNTCAQLQTNAPVFVSVDVDVFDKCANSKNETLKQPKPKPPKFTPPTIDECKAYATEIKLPATEVEKFFDHYEACGWRVGMKPMKNWQSAMRNWKRNFDAGTYSRGQKQPGQQTRGLETIRTGTYRAPDSTAAQTIIDKHLGRAVTKQPEPQTMGALLGEVTL
jgi:hypothetical protein